MAEEQDWETTFSPTYSSKDHLNAEQLLQTTSECWRRTPGTQKGSPFSSKEGRTKHKRQKERQKSQGWKPVLMRES